MLKSVLYFLNTEGETVLKCVPFEWYTVHFVKVIILARRRRSCVEMCSV